MDKKTEYNTNVFIKLILKYVLEGAIIAVCAYYIPVFFKNSLRKPTLNEIFSIALTASLTMLLLDSFADKVATGARIGAGFGIGNNLVNTRV
ncbi:MAG: hypothetical protein EBU90_15390 [Proteobacteria bacterium]|nr:hypothetical protein [Pseudomonadota bacterium]NBP15566.1 hypothetical protein [bacterium]